MSLVYYLVYFFGLLFWDIDCIYKPRLKYVGLPFIRFKLSASWPLSALCSSSSVSWWRRLPFDLSNGVVGKLKYVEFELKYVEFEFVFVAMNNLRRFVLPIC